MHNIKQKCKTELCNKLYNHGHNILEILYPFGFNKNTIGTLQYIDEFNKASKIILTEYFDNKLSVQEIYTKYNCSHYFKVWKLFYFMKNILEIKLRTLSEANKISIMNVDNLQKLKRNYNYKDTYHTTWENKIVYLRSSYELDFAKILDEQKISYDVEKVKVLYFDTQLNIERVAIPDFYIPSTNTLIEIKSYWTLDLQNMYDKRKSYFANGYNFKLILEHKEIELDDIVW